jgi:hypothetical protein
MAKVTLGFAAALILLGLIGYFGDAPASTVPVGNDKTGNVEQTKSESGSAPASKGRSVTAMIPAVAGVLLGICGLLALNPRFLKHAMHAAAMVGLLGTLAAGGRGMMGFGKMLGGDTTINHRALLFVWLMALLCGIFVVCCIQSFRNARKRRKASDAESSAAKS